MKKQLACATLAVSLLFCILVRPAAAAVTAIALTNQNLPEGDGKFNTFFLPVINNAGQVAFRSMLKDTSALSESDNGIYLHNGTSLAKIVRENEAPPDGNGFYDILSAYRIDSVGKIGFFSTLKGSSGGGLDDSALYLRGITGIQKLVRKGDTEPTGNGKFNDLSLGAFHDGRMAFGNTLVNTTGGDNDSSALFLHNGGTLDKIVREDENVPLGAGKFMSLFSPTMNLSGAVAFRADLRDTSGGVLDNSGIYVAGAAAYEVVRENALVPSGNGARFAGFNSPSLNNSSHVAFLAGMRDTAGGTLDDLGVFRWHQSTGMQTVARENDSPPEGNGRFNDFGEGPTATRAISVGGSGQVAFHAFIRETSGGTEEDGIYLYNGNALVKIARENDTVPGGDGKFLSFGPPVINANGHVAFRANLKEATPNTDQALYLYNGTSLVQVARRLDVIGGVTIQGSPFLADSSGCQDGLACGLNDSDQITFQASLGSAGSGVFLYTPGATPIALPGDYNNDKKVNAADYTVWRNNLGADITMPNDTTPGQVRQNDYGVWQSNYGQSIPGSGAGDTAAVPEPTSAALSCIAVLVAILCRNLRPRRAI